MDTNPIEAKKALQEAEVKFRAGDAPAAVLLALKAKRLFPNLHGLAAHLEAYRIHSAFNPKSPEKAQWYSILNVNRSLGLETIRKRFKELRALTHPDKCSSSASEGAFKLVHKAWAAICEDLNSSSTRNKIKSKEPRNPADREKARCPECSCECQYIDSRSIVFECKRCKLVAMGDGKEEGLMVVIRDGIANIVVGEELNTVHVHGGNTTVNGVTGVNVYGGQSVQLNQCKGVKLKGGKGIHLSNCTQINIKGCGI